MDENKLLVLEQDIRNMKELIIELKDTAKNQEKRIVELETSKSITEMQFKQIIESLNKLNNDTIPNLTKEIEELKNKPIKRYDQAVTGILGAICGTIGGAIAGIFIKK